MGYKQVTFLTIISLTVQCQQQWLDVNLRPGDDEAGVLPLCYYCRPRELTYWLMQGSLTEGEGSVQLTSLY